MWVSIQVQQVEVNYDRLVNGFLRNHYAKLIEEFVNGYSLPHDRFNKDQTTSYSFCRSGYANSGGTIKRIIPFDSGKLSVVFIRIGNGSFLEAFYDDLTPELRHYFDKVTLV